MSYSTLTSPKKQSHRDSLTSSDKLNSKSLDDVDGFGFQHLRQALDAFLSYCQPELSARQAKLDQAYQQELVYAKANQQKLPKRQQASLNLIDLANYLAQAPAQFALIDTHVHLYALVHELVLAIMTKLEETGKLDVLADMGASGSNEVVCKQRYNQDSAGNFGTTAKATSAKNTSMDLLSLYLELSALVEQAYLDWAEAWGIKQHYVMADVFNFTQAADARESCVRKVVDFAGVHPIHLESAIFNPLALSCANQDSLATNEKNQLDQTLVNPQLAAWKAQGLVFDLGCNVLTQDQSYAANCCDSTTALALTSAGSTAFSSSSSSAAVASFSFSAFSSSLTAAESSLASQESVTKLVYNLGEVGMDARYPVELAQQELWLKEQVSFVLEELQDCLQSLRKQITKSQTNTQTITQTTACQTTACQTTNSQTTDAETSESKASEFKAGEINTIGFQINDLGTSSLNCIDSKSPSLDKLACQPSIGGVSYISPWRADATNFVAAYSAQDNPNKLNTQETRTNVKTAYQLPTQSFSSNSCFQVRYPSRQQRQLTHEPDQGLWSVLPLQQAAQTPLIGELKVSIHNIEQWYAVKRALTEAFTSYLESNLKAYKHDLVPICVKLYLHAINDKNEALNDMVGFAEEMRLLVKRLENQLGQSQQNTAGDSGANKVGKRVEDSIGNRVEDSIGNRVVNRNAVADSTGNFPSTGASNDDQSSDATADPIADISAESKTSWIWQSEEAKGSEKELSANELLEVSVSLGLNDRLLRGRLDNKLKQFFLSTTQLLGKTKSNPQPAIALALESDWPYMNKGMWQRFKQEFVTSVVLSLENYLLNLSAPKQNLTEPAASKTPTAAESSATALSSSTINSSTINSATINSATASSSAVPSWLEQLAHALYSSVGAKLEQDSQQTQACPQSQPPEQFAARQAAFSLTRFTNLFEPIAWFKQEGYLVAWYVNAEKTATVTSSNSLPQAEAQSTTQAIYLQNHALRKKASAQARMGLVEKAGPALSRILATSILLPGSHPVILEFFHLATQLHRSNWYKQPTQANCD